MQKINFQNLPNTTTPINATNLNAIQTNAETAINGVATDLTNYTNGTTAMGSIKTTGVSINNTAVGNVANLNYTQIDNGLRLNDNKYFMGDYGYIKIPSSQSQSVTAYQYINVNFTSSAYFSSNTNLFEASTSGIKCKFKGTLLVITSLALSDAGEIDQQIGTRTIVTTGSRQNYGVSFIDVNNGDTVPLKFCFGTTTTLSIYDASIFLLRLS